MVQHASKSSIFGPGSAFQQFCHLRRNLADDDIDTLGGGMQAVRQKKLRLGVSLISGKVHAFDGATLTLRFARSFGPQKEQVTKTENMEFLRRMLSKYFGREIEVVCFQEGEERDSRPDRKTKAVKAPTDNLRGVAEDKKPLVKKLLDEFDGEIIRYNP